ncbi:MAG: VWA domain-containing protein [Anaerolineaceae bacterium]|nr:VWA domain-containing protein [Anaerolineaceae bacterium]
MIFFNPSVLFLFLVVPVVVIFLRWREAIYLKRIQLLEPKVTQTELLKWNRRRLILWGTCGILVIVALARPAWGTEIEPVETQGVSIMFVLDVSRSMDAQDVQPSRIERAKLSLQEMFKQLSGNEMGLILFAGSAIVQFPLTTDTLSAADFVKDVSTSSITQQGTNLTNAIRLAMLSLNSASKGKHLIVLLSDGEGHEGDVNLIVKEAAQSDISILTIGYGDTGGSLIPIHNPDGSIIDKTDAAGNRVVSALDETTLKAISDGSEGQYQHAGADGSEVTTLMRSISQYVPETLNRGIQTKPIEHFDIFLALAVALLTLDILLPVRQRTI